MRPALPVEEVEVRVDRLAAAREADREPPRHRVEEERAVALCAVGAPHRLARPRRHEDLRLDARDGDVRAHRRLRRQHAAACQRHVRGEAHALLHGAQLVDDAVEVDVLAVRQRRGHVHHVVELQVARRIDVCPEGERRRGALLRSEHQSLGPLRLQLRLLAYHRAPLFTGSSASSASICRFSAATRWFRGPRRRDHAPEEFLHQRFSCSRSSQTGQ